MIERRVTVYQETHGAILLSPDGDGLDLIVVSYTEDHIKTETYGEAFTLTKNDALELAEALKMMAEGNK